MNILKPNMAPKIFLDSNILLDYIIERPGELEEIISIFEMVQKDQLRLFISESVLTTNIYFLQKQKFDVIQIFRTLLEYIDIIPFKKQILFLPINNFKDSEDGLLYYLALDADMDYFITRNKKDFKTATPSLPVFTPKQFINHFIKK